MDLIAAVDLLGGRAVRLRKGDYGDAVGDLDAVALARRWASEGAPRLHVVDLEGARAGEPRQRGVMSDVFGAARSENPHIGVQAAGGLRTVMAVQAVFEVGADAAVLGTAALTNQGFLATCATRWPGRIVAALDVRDGRIALDGWLRTGEDDPFEAASRLLDEGAAGLIVTDTTRDGSLEGPSTELLRAFRARFPKTRLTAAGGIRSIEDLTDLRDLGLDGAIVGMALLTGALDLPQALATLGDPRGGPAPVVAAASGGGA